MAEHPRRTALIRLGDELCTYAGHLAAAEARWLGLLAEFDREEGWDEYGCGSCVHWLSWKLGKVATGAHLETLGRGYRQTEAGGGSAEPPPAPFVRYRIDEDGSIVGSFRLPPGEGTTFLEGLNAERQRQYEDVPIGDRPDLDEQAAAALVAMAEADLADIDPGASRFMITVHTDGPTLAGEDTGHVPTVDDGPDLAVPTVRRICCDAKVNRMVWGPDGEILDHGRTARTTPPALRRVVMARDKCCRFPGCGRKRHLKIHHIVHWADGGPTIVVNLIALCTEHHHLVHEGGWDVRGNANEAIVFYDQEGVPVDPGSVETSSDPDVIPLFNTARGLDIDAETVESTWLGERCDYDTMIIGLLARERQASAEAVDLAAA